MKTVSFTFSPDLIDRIDEAAAADDRSRSSFVREAVRKHLEQFNSLSRQAVENANAGSAKRQAQVK